MIRVGVVGLGMMGGTHLDVYRRRPDARVVAICDNDPDRLHGISCAAGNIEGQAQRGLAGFDDVVRYEAAEALIADPAVDLVDICLPTDLHLCYGVAALRAGKHVIVEKPLARTASEARQFVDAAEKARGLAFVAHCMRFWPGWDWLKSTIDQQRYGRVLAATFRRMVSHPGGPFYGSGQRCGGAALDLHIHDTDFVQHCFGVPRSVTSMGYSTVTDQPDHIVTHYHFDEVPLVVGEASWAMADGFRFEMEYCVNFEQATAIYRSTASDPLTLIRPSHPPEPVLLDAGMGYEHEIAYFLECIQQNRQPAVVTCRDALRSVQIVEAEVASVAQGSAVSIRIDDVVL